MTPHKLAPGRPIAISSTRSRRSASHRRSPSTALNTAWQKRDANHRFQMVRAVLRRNEIIISPHHPVRRPQRRYAFVLENGIDLFKLPLLGYRGIQEVREIKRKVLKNQMTQKDIDRIADAVISALLPTMATKTDIAGIKTDLADVKTDIAGIKTDLAGVKKDIADIKKDAAVVKTSVVGLTDLISALHSKFDKKYSSPSS